MAHDESAFKTKIEELENQIDEKNREIEFYKKELVKFSENLDMILSASAEDVQLLGSLHRRIVPTELPQIQGFDISRKFVYGTKQGGDYFDIFPHENKLKFGVLLSSASSYSVSAQLLSIILKNPQALEGRKATPVEKTLQIFGEALKGVAGPHDQAQIFYMVVDRRHLSMSFSCVGEITGILANPEESLKILSSDGPGISADCQVDYRSVDVELKSGSRICLVSQGIMQVLNQADLIEAVEKTLNGSVHDLRNQVLVAAQIKSGLDQPVKDQTVIVLEVKDNIFKLAKNDERLKNGN